MYDAAADKGYNSWFDRTKAISALKTNLDNAYNAGNLNWTWVDHKDGAEITYRKGNAYTLRTLNKDAWNALKINVPEAGNFSLVYSVDPAKAYHTAGVTAYIFKADALTQNTTVEALMTPENCVGTQAMDKNNASVTFDAVDFEAGEYIVAYQGSALIYLDMLALVATQETGETTAPTETTQSQTTVTETTEAESTQTTETTETTQPGTSFDPLVYDFQLYENAVFQADSNLPVDSTTGCIKADFQLHRTYDGTTITNGTKTVASWFYDHYGTKINWGPERAKGSDSDPLKSYMFRGTNDQGMRLRLSAADQYAAVRINVSAGGEYALVLDSGSNPNTVDIFVFKATGAYSESTLTSRAAIEAAMADPANQLKAGLALEANQTYNLGKWTFPENGDYIVVFKVKEAMSEGVSLRKLTLAVPGSSEDVTEPTVDPNAPTEPEKPDVAVADGFFDFEVYNYKAFSGITTTMSYIKKYGNGNTVGEQMAASYPDKVNWKVEAYSSNIKDENIIVRGGSYKQGLRVDVKSGDWIAFRLNVTKSGAYDVVFNTNNAVYSTVAYPYIFPATGEAMTAAQIEAGMVDANKLATVSLNGQRQSSNAGPYTFTPGEYILVLKATNSRICLSSIALQTHIEVAPKEPADKMTYNFHLVSVDSNFPQNAVSKYTDDTKTERIYTKIAKMYADNVIDWKYETANTTIPSVRPTYMRFKSTADWMDVDNAWTAFRIEAPGAGIYDVRLNCVDSNTAVANIYLIPAETGVPMAAADIKAAMTKENLLISKARLSGKGTFYLGEFTFGTNEEYVLVLQFVRGKRLNLINIEVTKDGLVADGKLPVGKTYPGVVYDLDLGDSFEGILQPYGEYRYDMPTPKEAGYAAPIDQANAAWKSGRLNWKWEMSSDGLVEKNTKGEYIPTNMMRFYSGTGMRLYGAKDAWVALRIKSPGAGDFTISLNHATCPNSGTIAMYILPGDTAKEDI